MTATSSLHCLINKAATTFKWEPKIKACKFNLKDCSKVFLRQIDVF